MTPLESVPLGENGPHSSSGKLHFTYNLTEAKRMLIMDLGYAIICKYSETLIKFEGIFEDVRIGF